MVWDIQMVSTKTNTMQYTMIKIVLDAAYCCQTMLNSEAKNHVSTWFVGFYCQMLPDVAGS